MITVDTVRSELQAALRFQLELEQAERVYRNANYDISLVTEEWMKYDEVAQKLSKQRAKVAELHRILLEYNR